MFMSQLDRHVAWVQSKLTVSLFAKALGWALLGYVSAVWLLIILQRIFSFEIQRRWMYC